MRPLRIAGANWRNLDDDLVKSLPRKEALHRIIALRQDVAVAVMQFEALTVLGDCSAEIGDRFDAMHR